MNGLTKAAEAIGPFHALVDEPSELDVETQFQAWGPTTDTRESLTAQEIEDLTAMVWGAPCTEESLTHIVTPVIRQYERLLATGERPVDPARGETRAGSVDIPEGSYLALATSKFNSFCQNVQRLSLKPGDLLVLTTDLKLSAEQGDRLRAHVAAFVPDAPILIMDGGITLGVLARQGCISGIELEERP